MAFNFGPIRWATIVLTAAAAGVVVLTACSARSAGPNASSRTSSTPSATATGGGTAPTPSVKKSPSLASPPFPKASPVTVAGWRTATSRVWDGYQFPVSGVTGVRAQWTQPSATGPAGALAAVWAGIGGQGQTNLIQAGTTASPPYLGTTYDRIWYELLPARPNYPLIRLIRVAPGDKIAVSIVQLRPPQENWQISIDDMSSDKTFTKIVQYHSDGSSPAFVVEDPTKGLGPSNPLWTFPHWGTISFSNMQIRIANRWKPAASIYGYRVQMVRNGSTLATAGPLDTASGFTAHQEP